MAPTKNPRARLLHIQDEIDGVTAALGDVSFDEYRTSYTLRRTAERAVQIISEAVKALPSALLDEAPQIPWNAIIGIGNVLRHEYQHLDDHLLWEIVTIYLPQLRPVIASLLEK